jgi:RimJ/RimL family protein N-acetyltransferase
LRGADPDGVELELSDESWVKVRPIRPDDKERLLAGFEGLSEDSRYKRFLTPMETLTPSQLRYLTEVDHRDHEALIACDLDGNIVGVGRYVREPGSDRSEAAVTVADDWQGRGLGTALTRLLAARATEEGISTFTALLLARNEDMRGLLDAVGSVQVTSRDGEVIEVQVPLAPEIAQDPALRSVLRAVAATHGRVARQPGVPDGPER